ncbi:hypothetical protein Esti_002176 [Eimeria stiedai]
MTLLPAFLQAFFYFVCILRVTPLNARFAAQYANGGPQCRKDIVTVTDGQCSFVCEAAWDKEADTNFMLCVDPMSCFKTFWEEHLRELSEVQTSLVATLQKQCSFGGAAISFNVIPARLQALVYSDDFETYASSDLELSGFFGGNLCGDLELVVVDFIAGHPTAFEGKDRNCSLYSAAAEANRACEDDKKQNQRLYCELSRPNIPTVPDLSELCRLTPSPEYQFAFFYSCIPPSNSPFECLVSSTSAWDTASSACQCPSGTSPCTLQEAKFSELWQDDLQAATQVYLSGSIRFLARYGVYEAFKYSYNPCRNNSAQALCKRDMGPNCFRGNDQPFCRMPCLQLWRGFQAENDPHNSYAQFMTFWFTHDFSQDPSVDFTAVKRVRACTFGQLWVHSEFQRIVESPADGVLSLENNCAAYERFSLVKVISGHRKALLEGLKIDGCIEIDSTDVVKRLLPDAFQNGAIPTFDLPISTISRVSDTCPSSDVAWFLAWNCSPDTSIAEESLPITCNVYPTTGVMDDNQHSCTCPNSTQPCGADAATVSGSWIKNLSAHASVSLADFLVYKTTKMGYGAIVVVDDLNSVCAEGPASYVLCEVCDFPACSSIEPACKRAFSTLDGATAADDRTCRTACEAELGGQCATALNPWLCVSSSLSKCYVPNTDNLSCHIETPGPEDELNGTCICRNSSFGACTSLEAIATAFAWESTLSQFVDGKKGVIVAKNSRALWAFPLFSWHYEGGPRRGKCEQADWIKGVFCLDAHAPDCAVASSKDVMRISTLRCRYLCGNLEWRCRNAMTEDPNRFSDLMECFEQLMVGTSLEHCEVGTSKRATQTASRTLSANLAASWLLASGVETEVRFANPVVPTPVVFIGASRPIDGVPKFVVSQVTSGSFKVQLHGGFCGVEAYPASPELKLVTSYLALPPGEYLAKHSALRLVVGRILITSPGDAVVQVPFVLSDPSKAVVLLESQAATGQSPEAISAAVLFNIIKVQPDHVAFRVSCVEPFITISVGYLVAGTSGEIPAQSALAASLGGRSLALFDSTEVTGTAITLPPNLPSLFQPHFFPQVAGRRHGTDTIYSLQWQEGRDQSWTPSVWGSKCNFIENLIVKFASSDVNFTGLYIAASKRDRLLSLLTLVCSVQGGMKTEEECSRLCSGIHLLYCSDSTYPLECLRALLPSDFNTACTLLSEDQPVEGDSDQTDVEDVPEEILTDVKCKVFDMRNYSSNLAWDSLTFTCACPGQSPACSQTAAARDLTWLKQLHEEGGLCEVARGAIKPVIQQFYQLNQDACSLAYLQDASLLPWSKRAYPAYPDFSGPGSGPDSYSGAYLLYNSGFFRSNEKRASRCVDLLFAETAVDEEEDTGLVAPQGPVVPPSCFAAEWGEWSVCDATCLGVDQNPQRLRQRSPLVAVDSTDSSTCVLEEKESCGDSLALCSSYCWSAPWTEWAECAELLVANKLVNARRRYRPIFAGAEFCDLEEIQEIDMCQGGQPILRRALEIERGTASGGGFTEVFSLHQSQAETSEWSGCDVPCLLAKGHQAQKRKLQRTGDAYLAATSGTDAPAPCEGLRDCNPSFDIKCSEVVPIYQSPDGFASCRQKCEKARLKCKALALVDALAKPLRSCLITQFSAIEFHSVCRFPETQRISWRTSCRPTFTRMINPNVTYSFLTNISEDEETAGVLVDSSSSIPRCSCLEHDLEPCTAEDIVEDWKGIRDTLLGSGGLCTTKAAQTPLWSIDEKKKTPDSRIFFGYAGFGKLHCPLRGYKKGVAGVEEYFTFTNFSSSAELNDFCEGGLDYWDEAANPLVHSPVPDCSKAAARRQSGVEAEAEEPDYCQKLCVSLKESCRAKVFGTTYKDCFVDPFQDPAFSEACTFKFGRIFDEYPLSEKEPRCEVTPWGDWSACSVSCISSVNQIGSAFRVRSREVLEAGKSSVRCRELAVFGTVEVDACPSTPLCSFSGGTGNAQVIVFTTKAPPIIASWSPDSTLEASPPADLDSIPAHGVAPQPCSITKVDTFGNERKYDESIESCSCPTGYRPCYRKEAVLSPDSWTDAAYRICSSTPNISVRARNFQEFSCVSRKFVRTTAIDEHSSHEEKMAFCGTVQYMFCTEDVSTSSTQHATLFVIGSLCLGALAGMILAYLALQYSVDLQKLMGLRGRFAEISVELEQMKEGRAVQKHALQAIAGSGSVATLDEDGFKRSSPDALARIMSSNGG